MLVHTDYLHFPRFAFYFPNINKNIIFFLLDQQMNKKQKYIPPWIRLDLIEEKLIKPTNSIFIFF